MLKARKANRVIRIPDEKKDAYAALGYKITDMNDKVVAKIEATEAENAKLKEQVTDLEAKLKEATAKTKETKQATGSSEAGKQADSGKQATK